MPNPTADDGCETDRQSRSINEKENEEAEEEEEEEEEDEWLVSCRCSSAKAISTLLSCLHHRQGSGGAGASDSAQRSAASQSTGRSQQQQQQRNKSPQLVTVFCNPKCLTFHVHGTSKQFQASVDIQEAWFTDYRVAQPSTPLSSEEGQDEEDWQAQQAGGEFCVNLTTVLDCLHVLGTDRTLERTQVSLSYNTTQEHLKMELLLEDFGILSSSTIPGMIPPDDAIGDDNNEEETLGHALHLAFRSAPTVARMIVQSKILQQVVPELESVMGASVGTMALSTASGLEIATVGHLGECLVSIPPTGSHIVMLEVNNNNTDDANGGGGRRRRRGNDKAVSSFPLHSLLASFRGLEMAKETCLTLNANGMMAIQHQVLMDASSSEQAGGNTGDSAVNTPCFVEFILCCLQNDEDDDDDEEEANDSGEYGQQSHGVAEPSSQVPQQDLQNFRSRANDRSSASVSRNHASHDEGDDGNDNHIGGVDGDEEDDDEDSPMPPSKNPLFHSLVDPSLSTSPQDEAAFRRRQRRKLGQQQRRGHGGSGRDPRQRRQRKRRNSSDEEEEGDDNSSGVGSRNLLGESDNDNNDDGENDDDENEEEEPRRKKYGQAVNTDDDFTQPLDVTAPASPRPPRHRHDDEGCSSPEIVYGPQN